MTSSSLRRAVLGARPHQRDVAADVFLQQLVGIEQVVLVVLLEDVDARRLGQRAEVDRRGVHRRGDVHEPQIEAAAAAAGRSGRRGRARCRSCRPSRRARSDRRAWRCPGRGRAVRRPAALHSRKNRQHRQGSERQDRLVRAWERLLGRAGSSRIYPRTEPQDFLAAVGGPRSPRRLGLRISARPRR